MVRGMSYDAPFAGLKVIDLSQGIAGPYCAMLLAQHGAEVIKVEGIGEGDWARTLGTRYGSHSAYSIIGNLGKKSIAVDLKTAAGKQVLWRLLEGADVFLEGFRPGAIRRLGFDYDTVAAREPRLLYLSISGFGQSGPLAERPAMDPVLQAYTGLMIENRGDDGIPHRVPVIVVDMSTALYAFQALSAALYARRDETRGRYIEASLMQAATALQSIRLMACHLEGGTMRPGGAPGGVFRIADGWMSIVAINDRDWRALCAAMQMPALADDPRFATPAARLAESDALYADHAAGPRGRAVGGVEQAADRGAPDARAAEQLRRVPRPAARARDRPDPVAHPGRTQPAGAGARFARHAAPGRGNAARHRPRHRPAHRRYPGRARFQRGRDRGPAGAGDGRGGMTTAQKKAVVVGALGVIGRYIVDRLLAEGDWQVVGLSRRPARNEPRYTHISVDLLDRKDVGRKLRRPVGHDAHLLCRRAARHRQGGGLRHGGRAQSRHAGEFGQRHRQGRTAPCRGSCW